MLCGQATDKFGGDRTAPAEAVAPAEIVADDRLLTVGELGKHNTARSCWLAIHNTVYDVTGFLDRHPGGRAVLLGAAGGDATAAFAAVHEASTLDEHVGQFEIVGKLSVAAADGQEDDGGGDDDGVPHHLRAAMEGGALAGRTSKNLAADLGGELGEKIGGDRTVRSTLHGTQAHQQRPAG